MWHRNREGNVERENDARTSKMMRGKRQCPGSFLDFCVEFGSVPDLSSIPRGNSDFRGKATDSGQKREMTRKEPKLVRT